MNINPWDDDFCWCQFNPIYLGLGISLTLALFTGLIGVILLWALSKKRAPLAKLYPGWAIVTGASSGVGKKFATVLASLKVEGIVLHASTKSEKALEALAKEILEITEGRVKTKIVMGDLSVPAEVTAITEQLRGLNITLLINNAGFGANGQFDKIALDVQLKMIAVNCASLLQLSHYVVEHHRERLTASVKKGVPKRDVTQLAIVNLGSIAAAPCGLPWQTTYAATKAFVSSFSHGIGYSLRGDGVRVLLVEPGTIEDTAFQQRSEQPLHSGANTSESVVRAIIDRLETPGSSDHLVPAFHDRITYYASKFLPDRLILRLGAKRGLKYSPVEKR